MQNLSQQTTFKIKNNEVFMVGKNKNTAFNYSGLIIIVLMMLLSGCGISDGFGLFADDEPIPVPVYTIDLNLSASNKLNPDLEERASPVVVRIYQLKGIDTFEGSDFFAIYENDEVLLGKDITFRKELEVKPNDEILNSNKLKEGTKYLGVFAAFRDLDEAVWQLVVEVKPEQTTSLSIELDQFKLSIKDGDGDNKKVKEGEEGEAKEGEAKDPEAKAEAEAKAPEGEAKGAGEVKADETSSLLDTFLEYIGFAPNPVTVYDAVK
ncbi:MAG: type VI secretion system lipoprotein TssJ [Methylococcaceae bacterium]|nr:type VI secretion system lipoprotein TssJ [Methylococcaceae bacterium]